METIASFSRGSSKLQSAYIILETEISEVPKLFISSTAYLEPFGPIHLGCNIEQLIKELTACCQEILDSTEEYPKIDIIPDLIPEIHLEGFE